MCSSNQGTQGYLDFYIIANNNCTPCNVYFEAEVAGSVVYPVGNSAATLGHHGPFATSLTNGKRVRLHVWAGILKFTGPWVWY